MITLIPKSSFRQVVMAVLCCFFIASKTLNAFTYDFDKDTVGVSWAVTLTVTHEFVHGGEFIDSVCVDSMVGDTAYIYLVADECGARIGDNCFQAIVYDSYERTYRFYELGTKWFVITETSYEPVWRTVITTSVDSVEIVANASIRDTRRMDQVSSGNGISENRLLFDVNGNAVPQSNGLAKGLYLHYGTDGVLHKRMVLE